MSVIKEDTDDQRSGLDFGIDRALPGEGMHSWVLLPCLCLDDDFCYVVDGGEIAAEGTDDGGYVFLTGGGDLDARVREAAGLIS